MIIIQYLDKNKPEKVILFTYLQIVENMEIRKRTSQKGKEGAINRSERVRANDLVSQMLEDHKKRIGEVVCIVIDSRTSIELPASLTQEERNEHVRNYIKNVGLKPIK